MSWLSGHRAPHPRRERAARRTWRPELLEPRLALSVATQAAAADNSVEPLSILHDAASNSQRTAVDQRDFTADGHWIGGMISPTDPSGVDTSSANTSSTSLAASAPVVTNSVASTLASTLRGQPASGMAAGLGNSPGQGTDLLSAVDPGAPRMQAVFGGYLVFAPPSAPPSSSSLEADAEAADAHGTVMALVQEANLEAMAVVRSVQDTWATVGANHADPSTGAPRPASDPSAAASAALSLGLPTGDQSAAGHAGQVVQTTAASVTQNAQATITANNLVPAGLTTNALYRVGDAERPAITAILPQLVRPPMHREATPLVQRSGEMPATTREMAPVSVAAVQWSAEVPAASQLLAGVAVNFEVLDRALEVTLHEIEQMGGDFVAWLDESDTLTLVSAATALVLATGGSYYFSRRRGTTLPGRDEEEPSSWLFTHLYIPSVRT